MFTGIIEETGIILALDQSPTGIRMKLRTRTTGIDLKLGDSLAVNGCCLTVTQLSGRASRRIVSVDLLEETWTRTSFKHLKEGALVNLERPLRVNGRLDGHIVTGHIDGVGTVTQWREVHQDWCLEIKPPRALLKYIVEKGSIAIDGISLTVAKVLRNRFRLWIIPHTLKVTRLASLQEGDEVNLETDLLAKHVERLLADPSSL